MSEPVAKDPPDTGRPCSNADEVRSTSDDALGGTAGRAFSVFVDFAERVDIADFVDLVDLTDLFDLLRVRLAPSVFLVGARGAGDNARVVDARLDGRSSDMDVDVTNELVVRSFIGPDGPRSRTETRLSSKGANLVERVEFDLLRVCSVAGNGKPRCDPERLSGCSIPGDGVKRPATIVIEAPRTFPSAEVTFFFTFRRGGGDVASSAVAFALMASFGWPFLRSNADG